MTASALSHSEFLPELQIDYPERQSRASVCFRLVLAIPHLLFATVLSIPTCLVAVIGWFAALVSGRLPVWAAQFLSGALVYFTQVGAYLLLVVDDYPPFDLASSHYSVRVHMAPPTRLNRAAVLFRLILIIPAYIISTVLIYGWEICAVFCWLTVLILGWVPASLFEASAAALRYWLRFYAYVLMLTPAYPKRLIGDGTYDSYARPTVPRDDLARQVTWLLTRMGHRPDSVTCPYDLPAAAGASTRCVLTEAGQRFGVHVEVIAADRSGRISIAAQVTDRTLDSVAPRAATDPYTHPGVPAATGWSAPPSFAPSPPAPGHRYGLPGPALTGDTSASQVPPPSPFVDAPAGTASASVPPVRRGAVNPSTCPLLMSSGATILLIMFLTVGAIYVFADFNTQFALLWAQVNAR